MAGSTEQAAIPRIMVLASGAVLYVGTAGGGYPTSLRPEMKLRNGAKAYAFLCMLSAVFLAATLVMWIRGYFVGGEARRVHDLTSLELHFGRGELWLIRGIYPSGYPPTEDDDLSRARSPNGWKLKRKGVTADDRYFVWLGFDMFAGSDKYKAGWDWHFLGIRLGGFRGLDPEHQKPSNAFGAIIPYWILAALLSLLPLHWTWTRYKTRHQRRPGRCSNCGYDLRASVNQCPECGQFLVTSDE